MGATIQTGTKNIVKLRARLGLPLQNCLFEKHFYKMALQKSAFKKKQFVFGKFIRKVLLIIKLCLDNFFFKKCFFETNDLKEHISIDFYY